jgi:hypothetical protein
MYLHSVLYNTPTMSMFIDNTLIGTSSITDGNYFFTQNITIGSGRAAFRGNFKYSELLIYTSNQEANRPLIENNINNYYNIYTGSNHGFVARWYDQSGNNRHASQTATGSQPLIVRSGSIVLEGSKPAVDYTDGFKFFDIPSTVPQSLPLTTFEVQSSGSGFPAVFGLGGNNFSQTIAYFSAFSSYYFTAGGKTANISAAAPPNYHLVTGVTTTTLFSPFVNGTALTTAVPTDTSTGTTFIYLNKYNNGNGTGKQQEVIAYPTSLITNREPIEYGINSYYNIYPQTSSFATSSFTIKADSGSISGSLNNRLTSGIASSGPLGLITVSRTGSNSLTIARNGVTSSFAVPASGALSTGLYLGAINNNGIAVGNSPVNISFASVGTGLTTADIINQDKLVNTLSYGLGRGLDSDYLNILSYARSQGFTLPSTQTQAAQNALIVELKQAGIWNKLDIFYVFASDGDANFATLNWKNTSLYRVTGYNSLVPNLGIYILSTDRVNTSFNPATPGINYKVTDASRYIYISNATSIARLDGSGGASNGNSMIYGSTSQTINNVSATFDYGAPRSLLSIHITGSSLFLTRGSTTGSLAYSGTPSIVNAQQSILNSGGGGSTGIPAMYALGASMVNEHSSFVLAFNKYMNRIS